MLRVKRFLAALGMAAVLSLGAVAGASADKGTAGPTCGGSVVGYSVENIDFTHNGTGWHNQFEAKCGYGTTVMWEIQASYDNGATWVDWYNNGGTQHKWVTTSCDVNGWCTYNGHDSLTTCSGSVDVYRVQFWWVDGHRAKQWAQTNC